MLAQASLQPEDNLLLISDLNPDEKVARLMQQAWSTGVHRRDDQWYLPRLLVTRMAADSGHRC